MLGTRRGLTGSPIFHSPSSCAMTVAIPAKNEAATIEKCLEAFERQVKPARRLNRGTFDMIVFANDCTDDTAEIARRFARSHPSLPLTVVEGTLPRGKSHVGQARMIALDLAADRQRATNGAEGIIASTDADSVVGADWVGETCREIGRADAVAGLVEIPKSECWRMNRALRALYDREREYRRLLGRATTLLDPLEHEALDAHNGFVGASFAVRVWAYDLVGGLAPLPQLEDLAFEQTLMRHDVRIRHSRRITVATSARLEGRVSGGFASFIAELSAKGTRNETYFVENAVRSSLRARARRLFRGYWHDTIRPADVATLERLYGTNRHMFESLRLGLAHGFAREVLERGAPFQELPDTPVEEAIAILETHALSEVSPYLAVDATGSLRT